MSYAERIKRQHEAEQEIQAIQENLEAKAREYQDMVDAVTRSRDELEGIQKEKDALVREMAYMKEHIEASKEEEVVARREGVEAKRDYDELVHAVAKKKGELQELRKKYHEEHIYMLIEAKNVMKRVETMKEQVDHLGQTHKLLKKRAQVARGQLDQMREDEYALNKRRDDLDAKKREFEEKDAELVRLRKEVQTLRGDISILKKRNGKKRA